MKKATFFSLFTACFALTLGAQQMSSAKIYSELEKLNVLGKVLYLAAHPDDENTRFIAYCANEKKFETAYLSLTRGDGGQNLIGPELREGLGVIRTQELLAARRTDGGMQFFTRANDFGYSKNPEETFGIWNKEEVLGDVVYAIRAFQPDVIVCRFPTDGGGGHGHHTASALLGEEAFKLAADPNAYPEQLKTLKTWQAKRIVVNTGRWWNPNISTDDPGVVAEDVGAYLPLEGISCNEIAAHSRTQHKSQGFGSTGSRGEQMEFFEHMDGDEAKESLFDGYTKNWSRIKGGEKIEKAIAAILKSYDFKNPAASIPAMCSLRKTLDALPSNSWIEIKKEDINQLILNMSGFYGKIYTNEKQVVPGDSVFLDFEVISRSAQAKLNNVHLSVGDVKIAMLELDRNKTVEQKIALKWPEEFDYSTPYWLKEEGTLGTYVYDSRTRVLEPENAAVGYLSAEFTIDGCAIPVKLPLEYSVNDPVKGEVRQPLYVVPPISIEPLSDVELVKKGEVVELKFKIRAFADYKGNLHWRGAKGWQLDGIPLTDEFGDPFNSEFFTARLDLKKGEETMAILRLKAEKGAESGKMMLFSNKGDEEYNQAVTEIEYDHIPRQVILERSIVKLNLVDLKIAGSKIGYLPGAGDQVPEALELMGYKVEILDENNLADLSKYDAIVVGIRFVNVNERAGPIMKTLLGYVENGGNLVMQYNTRHRLKTDDFAPYPITLSRDRVTDEFAKPRLLNPEHPVMKYPNKLSEKDFEGWVQERGLYFPGEWDDQYELMVGWNDAGESEKTGSVLMAKYGKGYYVYTGISFFRQLPAGVPGAYRLLANLIALKHGEQ